MKFHKTIFLKTVLAFIFLNYHAISQVSRDSSYFLKPDRQIENWEFFEQDNLSIKDSVYPSSKIIVNSAFFIADSFDTSKLRNIIWFRKKVLLDTSAYNKSLSLSIEINGAADVYIDQKLVKSFGKVFAREDGEEMVLSENQRISYPFLPNKEYVIAVRYSNHDLSASRNDRGENVFGFKMYTKETNDLFDSFFSQTITSFTFGLIISVFFFSLSFVHFIIFLFYRREKANIYYAVFCFAASALAGSSVFRIISYYETISNVLGITIALAPALGFGILPYMIRSFFKLRFPRWYMFFAAGLVLIVLQLFIGLPFLAIIYFLMVFASVIETVRAIYIAIRDKIKGVKIIAIGTSFFLLFVVIILFFVVFQISGSVNGGILGITVLIFVLLSIFSIPVSITIFLSYQISLTNQSLTQKLAEVETLSKQTIDQEKEKQKILENQKSMLEEQVMERTLEITDQKKIIEEKNKDIIDSINYAKRIQTSILPEMDYFKSVFANSFIIYQPRDIVSGDFYYVTEIDGLKILFIADCTGHGVPGALMSMVGSNLISKIIHENRIFEPKLILETLHTELRQALKQDQQNSDNRDGMDAAIVILKGEKLLYAGANRSLLYFNLAKELCEVKPTKTPIGGSHITKIDITQHELDSNAVSEFYLFSDGFADQFGGVNSADKYASGKKLMVSRFKKWLIEIFNNSIKEKEIFLDTEFQKWKGNLEQVDDVCVIGVKLK